MARPGYAVARPGSAVARPGAVLGRATFPPWLVRAMCWGLGGVHFGRKSSCTLVLFAPWLDRVLPWVPPWLVRELCWGLGVVHFGRNSNNTLVMIPPWLDWIASGLVRLSPWLAGGVPPWLVCCLCARRAGRQFH